MKPSSHGRMGTFVVHFWLTQMETINFPGLMICSWPSICRIGWIDTWAFLAGFCCGIGIPTYPTSPSCQNHGQESLQMAVFFGHRNDGENLPKVAAVSKVTGATCQLGAGQHGSRADGILSEVQPFLFSTVQPADHGDVPHGTVTSRKARDPTLPVTPL